MGESAPASPARTGVWIGIAMITMSFAAYTSALMMREGGAAEWRHVRLPPILYLNTAVLLASSGTLELARRGRRGAPSHASRLVRLTLALGLLFVAGQLLAWRALAAQGLFLATNPSSSFFYVLTALHALHLSGGLGALAWVDRRLRRAPRRGRDALDAAALYWHYMDVLWLYLLLLLALRL
jgi:cytochrome c oxidase subunit 3